MEKRSSRVQFGPGSVIYVVVAALVTFAAFYTQANLLFWLLGLVVGAFIVSLIVSMVSLRGITVHRITPTRGAADEPLVLRYYITNHSRWPCFGLEVLEDWPSSAKEYRRQHPQQRPLPALLVGRPRGWMLHIGPRQSIQAEAICWPRRRGLLRFEHVVIHTGFPFGILRKIVGFDQNNEVLIHPPLQPLNRQAVLSLASHDIGLGKHADRGGGQEDFFGLRPYRPGDSYKLIDWKHSARGNNLVSRELAKSRPPRMLILLDLLPPDNPTDNTLNWEPAQEQAINLAAALIREAYRHGVHVGMTVRGVPSPWLGIHNNQIHRQRLLDCLAQLDLSQTTDAPPLLAARPTAIIKLTLTTGNETTEPEAVIVNGAGRPFVIGTDPEKMNTSRQHRSRIPVGDA
ncbi:MAG: hypothetical protein Kow00105_07760 [Phycisphaeraceae bacterium]